MFEYSEDRAEGLHVNASVTQTFYARSGRGFSATVQIQAAFTDAKDNYRAVITAIHRYLKLFIINTSRNHVCRLFEPKYSGF